MREILIYTKQKLKLLIAVALATAVGGLTASAVIATIPDSNGQVNACYKNSSRVLSVTDPAGNCAGNETALSWELSSIKAYGHILSDGTLDTPNSKNISDLTVDGPNGNVCFTVPASPKNIQVTADNRGVVPGVYIRGIAPVPTAASFDDPSTCSANNNVLLIFGTSLPASDGVFVTVF